MASLGDGGLAASQDIHKEDDEDFTGFEDPAEAWIVLVVAYRNRDLNAAREAIGLAKASKWTEKLWNTANQPDFEELHGWEEGDEANNYGSQE